MDLEHIRKAYFIGIGGIGMSAIARYFHSIGIAVSGYDKTETPLTRTLNEEGIAVHYHDRGDSVKDLGFTPNDTLVVITPAVPKDLGEWTWFRVNGFRIVKRSQVLGLISDAYRTIAVAGTHGKTTTSTLVAHVLRQSHLDCSAFLGGISSNYNSNLLVHRSPSGARSQQLMVVEADEFDRSFFTLHPAISIITSTDADHLDIYGEHDALRKSFLDFAMQTRQTLIIRKDLDLLNGGDRSGRDVRTYSVIQPADAYADRIRIEGDTYFFDLHINGKTWLDMHLGIPGLHNVENAVAASAALIEAGITDEELREGLASFRGVKRRFEYLVRTPDFVYIDDYAHHPEELRAIISSVREMYRGKRITAVFQPHLFSRTRDFAEGFAQSLSLADELIMLDIYPARELPIEGVTSSMILEQVSCPEKMLSSKGDLVETLRKRQPEVLLTLGAGDIDQLVKPIAEALGAS